jgi:hypothetical protein
VTAPLKPGDVPRKAFCGWVNIDKIVTLGLPNPCHPRDPRLLLYRAWHRSTGVRRGCSCSWCFYHPKSPHAPGIAARTAAFRGEQSTPARVVLEGALYERIPWPADASTAMPWTHVNRAVGEPGDATVTPAARCTCLAGRGTNPGCQVCP